MGWPPILLHAGSAVLDYLQVVAVSSAHALLSIGSAYSLVALGVTLGIAAAFTLWRRRSKRAVPLGALMRALLPRRLWRSASGRTDAVFTLFSVFQGLALFGWAILGQAAIAGWTAQALAQSFGTPGLAGLPAAAIGTLAAVALFVTYEFAYWLDHYLSHKLPFLWHFHRVHHSAESLSLATNFRVHPVDTVVFFNLVALFTGVMAGLLDFAFGEAVAPYTNIRSNILLLAASVLLTHLQHTHLWITFGQRWGRVLLSPAHHQIHHSADPAHYDRNFGNCLALFDRLFGTLHMPAARREPLTFGVPELDYDPHSFVRSMGMPFVGAAGMARGRAAALVRTIGLPVRGRVDAA